MLTNITKYIIRISILLLLILLGFTAVFPEWLDFKDVLVTEYKEKRQREGNEKTEQSETHFSCTSELVVHKSRNSPIIDATNNIPRITSDGAPKVLINRDPRAFDKVCEGDTLEYYIYAANIDRMMVTYENNKQTLWHGIIQPVNFETPMKFSAPKGWLGNTTIKVTGFAKGEVKLASNRATFNIIKRRLNKAPDKPKKEAAHKVPPSFELKWRNAERARRFTRIQIIDGKTLYIAYSSNNIENWRMKIDLKKENIGPNSHIMLTNDSADVWIKTLSPSKRFEPALIKNVSGILVTENSINGHYLVRLEVHASDQTLPGIAEDIPAQGIYYIKGSVLVAE
ncbi:MAG: hypothetical protein L3J24_08215 [Xanthomonadales bacterium]|nr:hypothetical protein [Xanthomonadales bacterium]